MAKRTRDGILKRRQMAWEARIWREMSLFVPLHPGGERGEGVEERDCISLWQGGG
jgi:hypothetical protein